MREIQRLEDPGEQTIRDLIKIGDFAKMAGTNLRTLRYYEEIGLLHPAARSSGGFRYYRFEDLDRLRMVGALQRLGLELVRIRELMDTRANGHPHGEFVERVRTALARQTELIDQRIREIQEQRGDLAAALEKLEDCAGCEHHPEPRNGFCHPCQVTGKPLPHDLSALF